MSSIKMISESLPDLIAIINLNKHGKFISSAQARGIANATNERILFPIPQNEIDVTSYVFKIQVTKKEIEHHL